MKKLYTLALLLMPFLAQAQTLTLTVDGMEVENGSTFTHTYADDAVDMFPDDPSLAGQFFQYGLFPKVFLTSSEEQTVTVSFQNLSRSEGVQCCVGSTCKSVGENENYRMDESTTMQAGVPMDMRIHMETEGHGTTAYTAQFQLDLRTEGGETFSCTLVLGYDPEANGLQAVSVDRSSTAIYNLNGQRLAAPRKGVNIQGRRKLLVR
mgnify:CR=1 FL=1